MKKILEISILLLIFSLLLLSCASNRTKDNGSVATDDNIKAMFETHEYESQYNYFSTSGRWDRSPKAIVGINKDYVLVKESYKADFSDWQQFEPNSGNLKELVEAMDTTASNGFIIYASDGDQIGIMYAVKWGADLPEIQFKDENLIAVKPKTFNLFGSGAP